MAAPKTNGEAPLPKRAASKGMMPSAWVTRTLRVEYIGAAGQACSTSATLLDFYPAGLVLNIDGAKALLVWDRLDAELDRIRSNGDLSTDAKRPYIQQAYDKAQQDYRKLSRLR